MTILQAITLGVVQGLTEFLPISSSGHLLIVQQWFGFNESLLTFDIVIHVATLVAIILFFGRSLFKVTFKEWFLVGVGTIPAVVVGLLFKDQIEAMFGADRWVGIELILTGGIIFITEWLLKKKANLDEAKAELASTAELETEAKYRLKHVTIFNSFVIGVAQAIAIIPGISRSGSTLLGAIGLGLDREEAFRFSFLLAIPAIAGAGILQVKDVVEAGTVSDLWSLPYLLGAVAAGVTGIASLALFRYVINKAQLQWFGYYCVILGLIVTWWLF